MPRAAKAKRGEDCLSNVSISCPGRMQGAEPPGKSRGMLKAAKLRKKGWSLDATAGITQYANGTIHG